MEVYENHKNNSVLLVTHTKESLKKLSEENMEYEREDIKRHLPSPNSENSNFGKCQIVEVSTLSEAEATARWASVHAYAKPNTPSDSGDDQLAQLRKRQFKKKKGRKGIIFEKNWTSEEIETLIRLWRSKEVLYDVSSKDYLDKQKKYLALQEIADIIGTNSDAVLKKMNSLRSYYGHVRQSCVLSDRKNDGNAIDIKKPTWPYYEHLHFLNDNLIPRSMTNSLKRNNSKTNSFDDNKGPTTTKTPKVVITEESSTGQDTLKQEDRTEDEIFGQLIIKKLKKIPEGDIKEELKIEIQQLIFQARRNSCSK